MGRKTLAENAPAAKSKEDLNRLVFKPFPADFEAFKALCKKLNAELGLDGDMPYRQAFHSLLVLGRVIPKNGSGKSMLHPRAKPK